MRRSVVVGVGTWTLVLSLASLAWSQPSAHERYNGRDVVASEVLIKFKAGTSFAAMLQATQVADADAAHPIGRTGVQRIRSRSRDVDTLIKDLSLHPDVEYVEPNFILRASLVPNDPLFGSLWGLLNIGQSVNGAGAGVAGADIGAVAAWDFTTGSRANVVGVIDTGVDYTHPDLAANMWSAPQQFTVNITGVGNITCPAGSHGFNVLTNSCDPMDDHNHGTHVAGTIGATGNSAAGVVGVNWTASIMALKFLDASGNGTTGGAIRAIEFAIDVKAALASSAGANLRVLSASWGGGGFSQALLDSINLAGANGMLFVAAAGNESANNDTTPEYPASYNAANLIAVAATTSSDGLASFSNFGASSVDLGAPGVNIRSTVRGAAYAYFSGTSMATPHVSGAAALILSRCALNTASLRSLLLSSVDPVGALAGITSTGGRLNVEAALAACATALVAVSATPASGTGGIQTFSYAFSDSKGFADIASAQVVINGTLSGVNGCYLYYARAANAIWLVNDAATQYVGPLTLGAQGTLQNSQCVVDASASSAFGSGNTLTLNLALSFKAAFAGAKTNFMLVANNAGEVSGWQAKGTWTVTAAGNAPPAAVSVTPGSGSGPSQTFSYVFSDANGFADISAAQLLVNGGLNAANGCYLYYGRAANTIWLANDAGTQYVGSKTLGVAGTLQNNQCVVDAGASSASGVGNALTLNVALSFTPAFAGTKTNFMFVADNAGALSGWQAKGTWGVVAGGNAPPTAGSVTPGSGTGASQTFSYVFSDTNGVSDISSAQLVISAGLSAVNSCYLYYARAANAIWLVNDASTQYIGPLTLGTPGTLQNSQCVVNAGASSASGVGNTLTLNVALSFKPAFAGPKNNYVFVADNAGAMAGWLARGTWTVP